YGDSFRWFFSYQMSFMYWRYFMWNFSGKQNDIQGAGNRRDGNWITGIPMIDNNRLGDQNEMPVALKTNKANNKLYLLPFLLGILGCVYQFVKNRKDWIVNFLLFFFTGIAVVLYLNQPGSQPRERDYAYVGSFYVFALWIGLAVVALVRMAREKADKLTFQNTLVYGSVLTFVVMALSTANETGMGMILTAVFATVIYAAITAGLTFLLRALSSGGQNLRLLNITTAVICLIVPLLMSMREWDDHDRSKKTLAPDLAKNYLESCAPNAIIFTFGDNDTYPLWYAQEVEGVRPDIRIINNSLLGIDWYINQLRYKVNQADSVDVIWSPEQIEGHNREYLFYQPDSRVNQDQYYSLYDAMKNVIGKPAINAATGRDVGPDTYPVKKFSLPVDVKLVRSNGTVNSNDSVVSEVRFEVGANSLQRNDMMILNIIAANNWKRPIYFTAPYGELGFGDYLRKDGLAYRLVPVANKFPQQNWEVNSALRSMGLGSTQIRDNNMDTLYSNLMTHYEFGGADKNGVYFDEENRRHLLSIRSLFAEAAGNLADAGKTQEAGRLLDKIEKGMDTRNIPYAMPSRFNSHNQTALVYLEACYKAGKKDLAEKVRQAIRNDLNDQKKYYEYIRNDRPELFGGFERSEYPINEILLQVLDILEKKYAPKAATQPGVELPSTIQTPGQPDSLRLDSVD
ncbi:MAG TPA: DMT family transporter, partial [Chitinophagaceae bacterium]|nr:DMT family transporter [Chitinophagaceae bacterium]